MLLEQSDLAKGTSSRSTKLIHGGVRYLRQGNLSLVRQALLERDLLTRSAPHLVRKLPLLVPVFNQWERVFYGTGLKFYDLLSSPRGMGASSFFSKAQTLAHFPLLKERGLKGSVQFYDAQFDDSRLAIGLARTVEHLGGLILTYAEVRSFLSENGKLRGAVARDRETEEELEIRAKVTINATGVFSDRLRRLNNPAHQNSLAVSRGTHVVLACDGMAPSRGLLVPRTRDGRVLFCLPWHGALLAGTTDVAVTEPNLEPLPSRKEVNYILEHLGELLDPPPCVDDCLSVFAGLRPLIQAKAGAETAGLSREHAVVVDSNGLVNVLGGKWTTFRLMGEDALETAARVAGLPARPAPPLRILGAPEPAAAGAIDTSDPLHVYGTEKRRLEGLCRDDPSLAARIHSILPYLACQVVWAARMEYARTVEDVLSRRTRALILDAAASIEAAPAVARLMARELEKDSSWEIQQTDVFSRLAGNYRPGGPGTSTAVCQGGE